MNYQVQQLIDAVATMMCIAVCVKPPIMMLQTLNSYYEKRSALVDQYGSWQVGRAEAVCPKGDLSCIEREASRLAAVLRGKYA